MRLGPEALEALRQEVEGLLHPGEELVVAGAIALDLTEELLQTQAEFFKAHFSPSFLREAATLKERYGIGSPVKEGEIWMLAMEHHASACMEIGEEGFLSALWKMAEASGVGLHADLRKIPIRQETIEISECFDANPYQAASGHALLAGFTNAYAFVETCEKRGIPARVIGTANAENARLLYSGETCRYLDRPRKK